MIQPLSSWFHILVLRIALQANSLMGNPAPSVSLTSLCLPPSRTWAPQCCLPPQHWTPVLIPQSWEFPKVLMASLYLHSCFLPGLQTPFLMSRVGKGSEKKCNTRNVGLTLMTFPSLRVLIPQVLAASEPLSDLWTDFF